jgi:hypothetical protein
MWNPTSDLNSPTPASAVLEEHLCVGGQGNQDFKLRKGWVWEQMAMHSRGRGGVGQGVKWSMEKSTFGGQQNVGSGFKLRQESQKQKVVLKGNRQHLPPYQCWTNLPSLPGFSFSSFLHATELCSHHNIFVHEQFVDDFLLSLIGSTSVYECGPWSLARKRAKNQRKDEFWVCSPSPQLSSWCLQEVSQAWWPRDLLPGNRMKGHLLQESFSLCSLVTSMYRAAPTVQRAAWPRALLSEGLITPPPQATKHMDAA